ncbi:MAG: UDP-N-acetylmuramoyl-tripeptide--D-alanyl-D-alanine ligase [Gammaproteobacteria bacterium]|nr:UDP-N-acetylmuramoyl-tripeptide--D-alanyl-D-alanine ligase [Gammaproteobacteria bacterium]
MTLSAAAKMINAQVHGPDITFTSVSNDTRSLTSGALYVAIKGERFDGHQFLDQAQNAGAVAAMVDQVCAHPLPQLVVGDTRNGLGKLAAAWRQQFKGKIIGVTGSNGKTTVKEMIAAILAQRGEVLATRGNYNNDIGLPLTLLRLKNEKFAVIEMGANHAGEIAALTAITRPDVAVITNAGQAHLEGFGSLEGVARAKGEIYGGLPNGGVAIVNADDVFASYWLSINSKRRCLTFGVTSRADVQGQWQASQTGGELRVTTQDGDTVIHLPIPGYHNAMNALAAITATAALGVTLDEARDALENFAPVKGRLNFHRTPQGARLIDDTYNANPSSLKAGLQVLCDLPGEHWLVLGDMGELGDNSRALHKTAGELARQTGVHRLLAVGDNSHAAVEAFGAGASHYPSHEALVAMLTSELNKDVNVLVKGSRFMRMERVVNAVVGGLNVV